MRGGQDDEGSARCGDAGKASSCEEVEGRDALEDEGPCDLLALGGSGMGVDPTGEDVPVTDHATQCGGFTGRTFTPLYSKSNARSTKICHICNT